MENGGFGGTLTEGCADSLGPASSQQSPTYPSMPQSRPNCLAISDSLGKDDYILIICKHLYKKEDKVLKKYMNISVYMYMQLTGTLWKVSSYLYK